MNNASSRINEETRPFVVAKACKFPIGVYVPVPLGVVLADCPEDALQLAIWRWHDIDLLKPKDWEKVPPDFRLAAIKADRGDLIELDIGKHRL